MVLPASSLLLGGIAIHLAVRGDGSLPTITALGVAAILLAVRSAVALRSAEREQSERHELERTRGLVELSHTLAGAEALDGALSTVCEWGRRLLVADSAWIELATTGGTLRTLGSHVGRRVVAERAHDGSASAWLGGAETRQICTRAGQPELFGPEGEAIAGRQWVAAASIRFGGRVLGCIVVAQPNRALDATEMALLGALADQAAIAIENARLVEDARESERNRLRAEKLATVGQLVAGVAHEINNPLASIRSAADLLAGADHDEEAGSSIRLIQDEAARAAGIVRGMLDYVHPGEIELQAVDLNEVVAACLRLRSFEHSLLDVRLECELDRLPPVRVDRSRLQQVLVNLIVNAEQAMASIDRVRTLRIHGSTDGDDVILHVEDTGEGIRPQHVGRVFDPFFTTKGVGKGTGLGLSVSYGIVRELGGDITVASQRDVGTTFTVRLPAADPTHVVPHPLPAPVPAAEDGRAGELRVLLVDDEASLRLLLSRFLRRAGHIVHVAGDGREALALLETRSFDVIVTDLRMPDIDGPQLFAALGQDRPELVERVLFISGDTVGPHTRRFLDDSGRPFLAKPFTLADFSRLVTGVARHAGAATDVPVA